MDKLLRDVRHGGFQIVLIWSLDRLSRKGISPTMALVDEIEPCHCRLFSYSESWLDFPDEIRPLIMAVIAWIENFDSRRKSERVKAGMDTAGSHRPKGSKLPF